MDRGTIADSRDDDGSKPIRLSLCDDDDEDASIGSMASISSWLSAKVSLSSITACGKPNQPTSRFLVPIHEHKSYGNDKHVVLLLKQNGLALSRMPPFVRSSRSCVLAAVSQNGLALQYACTEFQNDMKLVMTSVFQNGLALQFASANLRNTTSIALVAVTQNGQALQFASRPLRGEKRIVSAAVMDDGMALEYASSTLRNDEEIVLTAIRQNRNAIRYLGHEYLSRVKLSEILEMAKNE
eukprot:scaffold30763_cov68-Cyclotella_meneghiniana.AAC.2